VSALEKLSRGWLIVVVAHVVLTKTIMFCADVSFILIQRTFIRRLVNGIFETFPHNVSLQQLQQPRSFMAETLLNLDYLLAV